MTITPEQREAQQRLQDAIENHCRVWTPHEETPVGGEMLIDWAVVMHLTGYNEEGHEVAAYRLAYTNGEMPQHRAVGLFEYASYLVKHE
jgi:hypothetical protein